LPEAQIIVLFGFAQIVNPEPSMTVMAIADQLKINFHSMKLSSKTKQILVFLFLLCFIFILNVSPQNRVLIGQLEKARIEFDNGDFDKSMYTAKAAVETAKKTNEKQLVSEGLLIIAGSQISLQRYDEAEMSLSEALANISENKINSDHKAKIYIHLAWLWRTKREFAKALDFSKKAVAETPSNNRILGEHYLNFGRILFSSGYDISAIIWLEKAEKNFESEKTSIAKLDNYRFLHLAWSSRLNYQKALYYAEKWVKLAEKSQFKYRYRQALFELSTIQSITGQKNAALRTMEEGRRLSLMADNQYQAGLFLSSLLLNNLFEYDAESADKYLEELEKVSSDGAFSFEILLGKAVISAFKDQYKLSEELFDQLDKMENTSEYILPSWKIIIAKRNKEWEKVIKLNQELLALNEKENFRDGLPAVYLTFAQGYFHLGQIPKSLESLEKTLSLVEEIRKTKNNNLSLGILEIYHDAYRLLAQIKADTPKESFELADFLKARFLKDKINDSRLKNESIISTQTRTLLEELSIKYFEDNKIAAEIERNEKLITKKIPELNLRKPDFSEFNNVQELENSAIISYFFTLDKKLLAFVWEKGKAVRSVELSISEEDLKKLVIKTHQDIKNRVFFKRDGKTIYDKLLKPLTITSKHLIIVPDKSLWKIPFQALSSDGEKYLIEEKLISYAPSASILLEQLKGSKPDRQTLQAFANTSFENRVLQYVNTEASTVAEIYGSKPFINVTVNDFTKQSENADILHFSMHAEVNNEVPLDSFLGFRKFGRDDGRLTVEELFNIKLKKGSLVFLASCDTNNVLSGEGLVSLAWAMIGSGATTVISSGWEANDKSTAVFTNNFYRSYRQGSSAAEAMQKAAIALIKDKSGNMHEPYYWADFTLNGDFR